MALFCLTTLQLSAAAKRKKVAVQPVRVACVGNSITYGTGIADREHFSYPVQLQQMLGNGYVVGNFGKPGATLLYKGHRPYVEQPEFKEALRFKGDIAVIHLGINDTDPRNWPNYRDEFVKDYLSIMDSLRAANPKVRFILARMTPIAHPPHQHYGRTFPNMGIRAIRLWVCQRTMQEVRGRQFRRTQDHNALMSPCP